MKTVFILFLINIYLLSCFKIQPYKTKPLNKLAIFSCITLIATIGILSDLDQNKSAQFFKDILVLSVILINIIFSFSSSNPPSLSPILIIIIKIIIIIFKVILMMSDFKHTIKCKILKYCVFLPSLQERITNNARKEFQAKKKWKTLKRIIKRTIRIQR